MSTSKSALGSFKQVLWKLMALAERPRATQMKALDDADGADMLAEVGGQLNFTEAMWQWHPVCEASQFRPQHGRQWLMGDDQWLVMLNRSQW
jgi:hypothetical protein